MTTSELESARRAVLRGVPAESRVLCAVSGGLDSVCLLHCIRDWGRTRGFSVTAAHFNHQLRGTAADRDEEFVRALCENWRIPLAVGRGDVAALAAGEGLSAEEAARKLRYDFLRKTAEAERCTVILTAHHADDNAETVLLNLLRGTGVRGLCGIPPEREGILRPFLLISRAELADYAAAHQLPHVEDETNLDPDAAARNFLRLQVMPLLRQLNPKAVEHIGRTAEQMREVDGLLTELAAPCLAQARTEPGRVSLALPDAHWRQLPAAARPRVLLGLLELLGTGRKDFGAVHLEALAGLVSRGMGQISLPSGVTARYSRGRLILEMRPEPLQPKALPPVGGGSLHWGAYALTALNCRTGEGLALRLPEETETLSVAQASAGAGLTLPGAKGRRSVRRLCMDRHIGLTERDGLPALYVDGRLAAVWRLGVDTEFLPAGEPCRFIQIRKETEETQNHEK